MDRKCHYTVKHFPNTVSIAVLLSVVIVVHVFVEVVGLV